jgi:hypothetical protein
MLQVFASAKILYLQTLLPALGNGNNYVNLTKTNSQMHSIYIFHILQPIGFEFEESISFCFER